MWLKTFYKDNKLIQEVGERGKEMMEVIFVVNRQIPTPDVHLLLPKLCMYQILYEVQSLDHRFVCMPRIIITSTEEMCSVNISVTNDEFIPVYLGGGGLGGSNLRSFADEEKALMHSVFDKEYCDWILYLSLRGLIQSNCYTSYLQRSALAADWIQNSQIYKFSVDFSLRTPATLFVFVLHHQVTLVRFLKCLRGCQNVFSKPLGGIDEWLAQHTASWGSRAEHFPKCCSAPGSLISLFCPPPTIFLTLREDHFCFEKNSYLGFFSFWHNSIFFAFHPI